MGTTRREFVKLAAGALAVVESLPASVEAQSLPASVEAQSLPADEHKLDLTFQSKFYRVELSQSQATFISFAVDSLGHSKLDQNVMLPSPADGMRYHVSRVGDTVEYRMKETDQKPAWSFSFDEKAIVIRTVATDGKLPGPVNLGFDAAATHPTLLGMVTDEGDVKLPAVLHFPAHGSFRLTGKGRNLVVAYDASRDHGDNFVRVLLPPTNWTWNREIEYRFEVATIHPEGSGIADNPRYDGYRRDYLSIFQLNPRRRALANNSASDATPITVFEYSAMASKLPPLAPGLAAMDLVRQTLERYIGGMSGYGMIAYLLPPRIKWDFLDVYPSLVMAAADYVRATGDKAWSERYYSSLRAWAEKMIEFDTDNDGLMEYALSGNSGSWPDQLSVRPANWWDTIGFGHKDAYSNALALPAYEGMVELAGAAGQKEDAERYRQRAEILKSVYYRTFYNPATGVLAGWKSADGKLHDYYFTFVSGMAVTYGLVTQEQGNRIWDAMLAKMRAVGFDRFDLGLPGNLIPIRREDYVDLNPRYGGPAKEDGSDGFQIFENGGASACYAYYTIEALRKLGRDKVADRIFYPILKAFKDGGFQGRGPGGMTYDSTDWKGNPHGYEGLLVDNYLTLLAAVPKR